MYFKLRRDAERWFDAIVGDFETKFDQFYFCLMAGLCAKRKRETAELVTTDLVDNFPGKFRARGKLIVGALLTTEIERNGISLKNKEAVNQLLGYLVMPESPSHVSDDGVKLMNEYAAGGFDALCEVFTDKPRTTETFIRRYAMAINQLFEESRQQSLAASERR